MTLSRNRIGTLLVSAAAFAMTASPAFADGWGGGRRHRGDDISAGDVFAGILVIGGIAAIASAASKSSKEKRERERDYRYPESRYPDREYDEGRTYRDESPRYGNRDSGSSQRGYSGARGIDGAVDTCVGEVERGSNRVDSVDTVGRDGDGWRVEGRLSGGRSFACSVDQGGRIRSATIDGRAADAGADYSQGAG